MYVADWERLTMEGGLTPAQDRAGARSGPLQPGLPHQRKLELTNSFAPAIEPSSAGIHFVVGSAGGGGATGAGFGAGVGAA